MLIGVSGKLGSGKSTFAEIFTASKPTFVEKSFAYKLKFMVSYITNQPLELMFTHEGKNTYLPDWKMTIGQMQQKMGTEAMRNGLHTDAWVLSLFADYREQDDWIVTDLRFKNEADSIKERGGILVRINGDPAKVRKESTRDLNHLSETDLDDYMGFDFIIENTGSLQKFGQKVDLFCTYMQHADKRSHDMT